MDQIIELIQWSAQPDNNVQKQVYKRSRELGSDPQFLLQLCSVIIGTYEPEIRFRAAVILKNAIRDCQTLPQELHQMLIQVDLSQELSRQAFTIVVPEIVIKKGLKESLLMLNHLVQLLDRDPVIATDCLSKIIEDLKLNTENINYYDTLEGLEYMDQLIVKFLQLVQSNDLQVVINAINFLNFNVFFMPPSLQQNAEYYVNVLLLGTQRQEAQIRIKCYQGLQALIETKRDKIKQIDKVVLVCVNSLNDPEKEVVRFDLLCLTDFLRIDDAEDLEQVQLLKPHLNSIIPQCILNLQITKTDQVYLQPTFSAVYNNNNDDNDEEEEVQKALGEYSLRQVANEFLKKLLEFFDKQIVPLALQIIEQLQQSQDWKQQEVAILCLGIFADQIIESHDQAVPKILTTLFNQQNQQNEYLYATTLWTFSKYNQWIKTVAINETQFIQSYLKLLIISIENPSILVKESACSALNSLTQDAFFILKPYLVDIFNVYLKALSQEGGVLLYIYQSLTTTLQECDNIENQELVDLIMNKLIVKLVNLNDYSICPLYECLTQAIEKFGIRCVNFLKIIYQALITSLNGYVQYQQKGITRNIFQQKEILKRAFDVCIQIISILKQQFLEICDPQFLKIIELSMLDPETDVKQYSLSLIGELIKSCYQIFQGLGIAQLLNDNIYAQSISIDPSKLFLATSNNAAWALGELALKDPNQITPIFDQVMEKLTKIINEPKFPKAIAQNLCVAILRIAGSHIQGIENIVPQFFKRICLILSQIKSQTFDEYKEEAFRILINIIKFYPNSTVKDIKYFVYCVAISTQFQSCLPDIVYILTQLLQQYGQQRFDEYFGSSDLPQGFRAKLQNLYGV